MWKIARLLQKKPIIFVSFIAVRFANFRRGEENVSAGQFDIWLLITIKWNRTKTIQIEAKRHWPSMFAARLKIIRATFTQHFDIGHEYHNHNHNLNSVFHVFCWPCLSSTDERASECFDQVFFFIRFLFFIFKRETGKKNDK